MSQKEEKKTHRPGFSQVTKLSFFICNCPECGKENEISFGEINRPHFCSECGRSTVKPVHD